MKHIFCTLSFMQLGIVCAASGCTESYIHFPFLQIDFRKILSLLFLSGELLLENEIKKSSGKNIIEIVIPISCPCWHNKEIVNKVGHTHIWR
jgi:hypothetical protein